MQIKIAEKLRPFSHEKKSGCILPGTVFKLTVFAARLIIEDISTSTLLTEMELDIKGPVKDFTVIQDLEVSKVSVFGHAQNGYFRYHVYPEENSLCMKFEKFPDDAQIEKTIVVEKGKCFKPQSLERLSLGNHKAQDWQLISRRLNMVEIFPLWYYLGQQVPKLPLGEKKGTLALLEPCAKAISAKRPEKILKEFETLFLAGFSGMLVPRLEDTEHQGLNLPLLPPHFQGTPLPLLTEGYRLIRSLFVKEEDSDVYILPALPPEFHCGRLLHLNTSLGIIDLEWIKKSIRRLILKSCITGQATLHFPRDIHTFRLRKNLKEKGMRMEANISFTIEENTTYFLDNFM